MKTSDIAGPVDPLNTSGVLSTHSDPQVPGVLTQLTVNPVTTAVTTKARNTRHQRHLDDGVLDESSNHAEEIMAENMRHVWLYLDKHDKELKSLRTQVAQVTKSRRKSSK